MPRRRPYTEIGIRRIPCFRCGEPSTTQWQICSDGNVWRGLCGPCDVGLNAVVLIYLGDARAAEKIERYREARL